MGPKLLFCRAMDLHSIAFLQAALRSRWELATGGALGSEPERAQTAVLVRVRGHPCAHAGVFGACGACCCAIRR